MSEQRYGYFKGCSASARHKKNGSKSKRCSLPSDNMTQAQWKKRNGAVVEYRLDKPLSFEGFKQLPVDLRKKYIKTLQTEYGASLTAITHMLGVSKGTAYNFITKDLGITFEPGAPSAENRQRWKAFLQSVDYAEPEASDPEPKNESLDTVESVATERQMKMNGLTLTFVGLIDANAIANSLRLVLGDNAEGTVRIDISDLVLAQ